MGSRDHVTRKTIAMICQSGLIFSFLFFNVYANDNWNDCRYGLKLFRKEHLRDPIDFEFDKWTDKNVQIKSIKNTMDCCFKIQIQRRKGIVEKKLSNGLGKKMRVKIPSRRLKKGPFKGQFPKFKVIFC